MTQEASKICCESKRPARISGPHTRFKRPPIDIRTRRAPALLFFQNNQDCMLCDLSSVRHEFDPLDSRQAERLRLCCHSSGWQHTCFILHYTSITKTPGWYLRGIGLHLHMCIFIYKHN